MSERNSTADARPYPRHWPNMSLSGCYDRGYDAYGDGADIEDNPETTALGRVYWHNGWCAARDDMPNVGGE